MSKMETPQGIQFIAQVAELWPLCLSLALIIFGQDNTEEKVLYTVEGQEKAIESIFDMHHTDESDSESWKVIQEKFIQSLTFQIMGALGRNTQMDTTLAYLRLLRHPSLFSMWLDPKISSLLSEPQEPVPYNDLDKGPTSFEPNKSPPSFPAASTLAYTMERIVTSCDFNPKVGDKDWNIIVTSVSAMAFCLLGNESHKLMFDFDQPQHIIKDPVFWVITLLQSLRPMMVPGMRLYLFVIDKISGTVKSYLGTTIHCVPTPEKLKELELLQDPVLITVGCMLLGWDYTVYFPRFLPNSWAAEQWKAIYINWYQYAPTLCLPGDVSIASSMAAQQDESWPEILFEGLDIRLQDMRLATANKDGSQTRGASLSYFVQTGLAGLKNIKIGLNRGYHFMFELAALDGFVAEFISQGGLDVLSALTWPYPYCSCPMCIGVYTPMQALLAITKGTSFVDTLPINSLRTLLWSPLVVQEIDLPHTASDIFRVIRKVHERLVTSSNGDEAFPEAASTCAQILNQALLYQTLDPQYWKFTGSFFFDTANFNHFCYDMRIIITKLRGFKGNELTIKVTDSVSEIFEYAELL
ncbi:hypothetical protein CPB86DRAFT_552921 [Serendipita vermifera]|nr:hypothetical protein CPB86DRAFT_552921 [Serendipita vermifera]